MKSSGLYNVTLTLFIIGLIVSAYLLYSLPGMMEEGSMAVTPDVVKELSGVLMKLYLSVGITLLLGIYSVLLLTRKAKKQSVVEKVVYVDKSEVKETSGTETEKTDDTQKEIKATLKEIEDAVKQKKTFQTKCEALINTLCQKIEAGQGLLYQTVKSGAKRQIQMVASYAFSLPDSQSLTFEFGEGLAGQSAKEGKAMKFDEVPEGYITVVSGLGSASPNHLLIKPVIINGEVEAVVELASFKSFDASVDKLVEGAVSIIQGELEKETEKKPERKKADTKKEDDSSGKTK